MTMPMRFMGISLLITPTGLAVSGKRRNEGQIMP
jgi:hypothetical protein